MATMSIGKTAAILRLVSWQQNTFLPLRFKISRVCFTSASKYSQGQHAAGDDRRKEYSPYNADESVQEPENAAADSVRETMDKTKQTTGEMKDKAKESKDRAMDGAQEMNDKSKEKLGTMADKANDMREDAMEKGGEMADKTKEYAYGAKEKTESMAVAEMVSEKAKQTVQEAWDAAKGTAKKVKETVVGTSSSSSSDDFMEDHVKKPASEGKEKVMNQDVMDSRRKRGESGPK